MRILAQHKLGIGAHDRGGRGHQRRQSWLISAQMPGSPSRQKTTRPGHSKARRASSRATITNISNTQPGIAPGQVNGVAKDTARTANSPIVRATQSRKGAQGSRRRSTLVFARHRP